MGQVLSNSRSPFVRGAYKQCLRWLTGQSEISRILSGYESGGTCRDTITASQQQLLHSCAMTVKVAASLRRSRQLSEVILRSGIFAGGKPLSGGSFTPRMVSDSSEFEAHDTASLHAAISRAKGIRIFSDNASTSKVSSSMSATTPLVHASLSPASSYASQSTSSLSPQPQLTEEDAMASNLRHCISDLIFARRIRATAHFLAAETVFTRASTIGPSSLATTNHHEALLDVLWAQLRPGLTRGGAVGGSTGSNSDDPEQERAIVQSFVTSEWGEVREGSSSLMAVNIVPLPLSYFRLSFRCFFYPSQLKIITTYFPSFTTIWTKQ